MELKAKRLSFALELYTQLAQLTLLRRIFPVELRCGGLVKESELITHASPEEENIWFEVMVHKPSVSEFSSWRNIFPSDRTKTVYKRFMFIMLPVSNLKIQAIFYTITQHTPFQYELFRFAKSKNTANDIKKIYIFYSQIVMCTHSVFIKKAIIGRQSIAPLYKIVLFHPISQCVVNFVKQFKIFIYMYL